MVGIGLKCVEFNGVTVNLHSKSRYLEVWYVRICGN